MKLRRAHARSDQAVRLFKLRRSKLWGLLEFLMPWLRVGFFELRLLRIEVHLPLLVFLKEALALWMLILMHRWCFNLFHIFVHLLLVEAGIIC